MEQLIVSADSTIISTFQSCARKAELSFIQNLKTPDKAEALERGDLIHKMLEVYYSLQLQSFDFQTEVWREIIKAGIKPPKDLLHGSIVDFAISVGRYFSTKMDLPTEEVDITIYQFREYCLYFEHDSWHPLAVEEVGSKILYEDEKYKFIFNFKIDLVAEQGRIIAPFDHKTSKRRESPTSLSNQFIGYCYGLSVNNIVVNKIGFQKTLTPQQRFNRFILSISEARIDEWKKNTIWWYHQMVRAKADNFYPQNFTSCDKYSGCIYQSICESDPEGRLYKIERDFKVDKPWDVAGILEEQNETT